MNSASRLSLSSWANCCSVRASFSAFCSLNFLSFSSALVSSVAFSRAFSGLSVSVRLSYFCIIWLSDSSSSFSSFDLSGRWASSALLLRAVNGVFFFCSSAFTASPALDALACSPATASEIAGW